MPNYSPPPANLDHLNPIQRYMQKGSLDRQDYVWLFIFVLAYFSARPYVEKLFKWIFAPKEFREGEAAQREFAESKLKAKVGANTIRGSKKDAAEAIPILEDDVAASGSSLERKGKASNRKAKVSFAEKTEEEKLLDWDDEPARAPIQGETSDVKAWLDKWDQ